MLESNFKLPGQTAFYKGKVRDVYTIEDKLMVMVVSDRISAFDVVLPRPIPFKGQVLNQVAAIMLEATKDIVPNWVKSTPLPNTTIGLKCDTFPVEMVVRGNLTGHAWRTYKTGERVLCGVTMPDGMKENDFFPTPIITPTTKAHEGHDEDISREEIVAQGLVSKEDYEQLEKYTLALFQRGKELAAERGLILVDTKYEFGKIGDTIYVIDEIHTPDSSRYFYAAGYEENQQAGIQQKQLSKEFVREWLMENGFQGKDGQQIPVMTDEFVNQVSERYIELFEKITGRTFVKEEVPAAEVEAKIAAALQSL
ncbi:phosphoribosylaminoimidazolesuccinocarboxamide synthase [Chitinophaga nivalis]|uniref:Phosphoribosylaminoimidazole-succinocarboxamide synthase n=1 Tax=Chitinophaga nivalis TaxID=2991709 RepID=A0ABT3ILD0_9BACT|nr:phosphoribosylaminoimidazolesuccinocarboxamide synthase [Chitinophaga nivalis]MCW3465537.1 phosphoribosylaminoimidazolesuccinocarboxamide synthase [Chitinophaga nivalis]MCW3484772.1 phosphoribosylaminoimidazolesuccinocarboxamide synthase [Chitinophaga nivalis]